MYVYIHMFLITYITTVMVVGASRLFYDQGLHTNTHLHAYTHTLCTHANTQRTHMHTHADTRTHAHTHTNPHTRQNTHTHENTDTKIHTHTP